MLQAANTTSCVFLGITDMYTPTSLTSQLKEDYLAYSMAVLVGRAIPSLTDGLKPAQRRVLTAMKWLGLKPEGKYMKSARVEGETMGKLHPHGGAYSVMVTLAAPWNNNLPLIDGQGNWGSSVDGAAASRYTEARLTSFSWDALLDDSDTWQTVPNYDGSLEEPVELNATSSDCPTKRSGRHRRWLRYEDSPSFPAGYMRCSHQGNHPYSVLPNRV